MAGIYIHIPFCRKACYYCDFHFSVNHDLKKEVVESIVKELFLRKDYLNHKSISTIYLGGGTPSLLTKDELEKIFDAVHNNFTIDANAEITVEGNPDDLTKEKIRELQAASVNRLSVGVQSFFNEDLKWMNRAHSAEQSLDCIRFAQDAGLNNISIDLIYGLPDPVGKCWDENLEEASRQNVQHLSCYCLTVEERTPLASLINKGQSKAPDEENAASQFERLMSFSKDKGWIHYEISNFCRDGLFSRHNMAYWNGEEYLGVGPSAHSFNRLSRQWNIANNHKYVASIANNVIPSEIEHLTPVQGLNESVMTSLRTMWGLNLSNYSESDAELLDLKSVAFRSGGFLEKIDDTLVLTDKGKLIADKIILEMMFE